MSTRRALRVGRVVMLLAAALAACTSDDGAGPPRTTAPGTSAVTSSTSTSTSVAPTSSPSTTPASTSSAVTTTTGVPTTATSTTTTTTTTTSAPATSVVTTTTRPPTTTRAPTTTRPTTTATPTTRPPTTAAAPAAVVVRRGDTDEPVVALTFDAGSDCGDADAILDVLEANDIRATFGLTGRWVERCPTDAARIAADGHDVMNHSYSHPSFTGYSTGEDHLTQTEIIDQLDRGEDAIVAATGINPRPLFRPPYGDYDDAVNTAAGRAGYRYNVMWTVDSFGWKGIDPDDVTARVLAAVGNGAIVLMHVGADSTDLEALQDVIDGIRARGLSFATVEEIL